MGYTSDDVQVATQVLFAVECLSWHDRCFVLSLTRAGFNVDTDALAKAVQARVSLGQKLPEWALLWIQRTVVDRTVKETEAHKRAALHAFINDALKGA
jgi:hypothetical protein